MLMGIAMLAIWTIGALLLVTDPGNRSSRWASAVAFIGGFGFLSGTINEEIRPILMEFSFYEPWTADFLSQLTALASFICQAGLPYTFLMFAIYSGGNVKESWGKRLNLLLFLPVLYTITTTPVFPAVKFNYPVMVIWVVPYLTAASLLLIFQLWKEKDPILRRSRFLVVILAVFPILFVLFTIYIARLVGDYEAWKYNLLVILVQFIFFLVFAVKYGVLGVRLRVEQNRMTSTLRALTSGAAILNHTLKNELGKIQLLAYRIERVAEQKNVDSIKEDIRQLQDTSQHILDMVQRIQGKTKDIELDETTFVLSEAVQDSIEHVLPFAEASDIAIQNLVDKQVWIKGDRVHIKEVLINLLRNGIEAMKEPGCIRVDSYPSKKYHVVTVQDTGKGITKENMTHIFEPFFSTKKRTQNFGLGLAYCFQVMRKHQGLIEVDSVLDEGTTFFLYFPRGRVLFNANRKEIENE